jgi:serine protease Do
MESGIDQIITVGDREQQKRQNWTMLSLIGVAVLLIGVLAGSVVTAGGWFKGGNVGKVPIYVSADPKVNEQITLNGGFSAIAKSVTPAVVTINVKSRTRARQQLPFFMDPFRDLFPRQDQDDEGSPRRQRTNPRTPGPLVPSGHGSGVIVSPDGYILTNNHVVEEAEQVDVELSDRRQFRAKVIGKDQPSDVAVIKIDATDLPSLTFGDSDKVEVGDLVLAVGNPLNIGQTVTMGIISAKGRRSPIGGEGTFEDFLQTDAAINRGNSGGALVNLRGELIGIPSQILSQTGGNIGIGFAIPTKMARSVMDQLVRSGKVRRGMLGVYIDEVDPAIAKQFGYKGVEGAFVQDVNKGYPADAAGVKPGDIITEFNGQRIKSMDQLRNLASSTAPGTTVKFKVWRDGSERELSAKLTDRPETATESEKPAEENTNKNSSALNGVSVDNLNNEWIQRLRLDSSVRGVVVTDIDQNTNAATKLEIGDVIVEVNKTPVTNVTEFSAAMQKADKKEFLLRVRMVRNRTVGFRYVTITQD